MSCKFEKNDKVLKKSIITQIDYREGWPMSTAEAETNGDSKSTKERGSFLGWFVFMHTRDFWLL
jgi:hypothetical protein